MIKVDMSPNIDKFHKDFFLKKENNIVMKLELRKKQLENLSPLQKSCILNCHKVYVKKGNVKQLLKCPCYYTNIEINAYIKYLDMIIKNFEKILLEPLNNTLINSLEDIIKHINEDFILQIKKEIQQLFLSEYNRFVEGNKHWGAYQYVKELDINICPYCNSQFVFTVNNKNGKTRPDLDHFMAKSIYPYLSISLYNLVPSCKICNSSFKGAKETNLEDNIYPFKESFGDKMQFIRQLTKKDQDPNTIPNYFDTLLGLGEDFEIKLEITVAEDSKEYKKIRNNIDLFNLDGIYSNPYQKKYVKSLILKAYLYNEVYKKQLEGMFPTIFPEESLLQNHIYINEYDFKNEILAKLTNDIIKNEVINNRKLDLRHL